MVFYLSTCKLFQTQKFTHPKITIFTFGSKIVLNEFLSKSFLLMKKLMPYLKSGSSNLLTCKVSSKKKKTLNLGPKTHYLDIFRLQFNKNYFKIFDQHHLWAGMLKTYCHICNQRPIIFVKK